MEQLEAALETSKQELIALKKSKKDLEQYSFPPHKTFNKNQASD